LPDGATPCGAPESCADGADHDNGRLIGFIGKIEEACS
jgi:hypothetical protein